MLFLKIMIVLMCLCGFLLSFMGIAGTFLIALAYIIFGLADRFHDFSVLLLLFLILLSIAGEIVEFFSASIGSKKFGASNISFFSSLILGILGGVWGTVIFPVVGTLIGTIAGASVGAFVTELFLKGKFQAAAMASIGVVAGKTGGILFKTFIAFIMAVSVIVAIF